MVLEKAWCRLPQQPELMCLQSSAALTVVVFFDCCKSGVWTAVMQWLAIRISLDFDDTIQIIYDYIFMIIYVDWKFAMLAHFGQEWGCCLLPAWRAAFTRSVRLGCVPCSGPWDFVGLTTWDTFERSYMTCWTVFRWSVSNCLKQVRTREEACHLIS